jgi:tetratricopeptide (TPR) repeat protein
MEDIMTIEVFISYSHKDQTFREELEIHLSNLKRQNIISSWYDGDITPGSEWEPQIMDHLTSAQIILLLISADFIHSDFCYSIEMNQAIDRHNAGEARVIPILLRPTDWQGAPFDKLKMLPTDAKVVTSWPTQDDAFLDVVQGIRKAIDDLTNNRIIVNPSIVSGTTSSGTTQVPIWNIPYQRNLLFTGREDVLKKLSQALRTGKTAALAQPQAISGLGGIGKTQTAVEYAYRYKDDYKAMLWVKAETEGSINSDFVTIASLLDLPEKQEQDQHKIVEAVKRWFQEHTEWLLILDNADDISMVQGFIPLGRKGHILLTTRAHATGRVAQRIEVEKMEPDEGALFLLHRATIIDPDAPLETASRTDQDIAREIVNVMDGLPLALEQAGAYIEETECGLQGYLRLYQTQGVRLLKEHGEFVPDHPEPVATTWSLSFEKVEQANAAAAEFLRFCAFLAPDAIPEELFTESAAELGSILELVASDLNMLNAAIRELLKYSLVHRDPEIQTLSIHRLVQEVLKDAMSKEVQREWAGRAVRAVSRAFPAVEFENWDQCRRMLTHAQTCEDLITQWNMELPEASSLLFKTGSFLRVHGQYVKAEPLLQSALAISAKALNPENPDVATMLNGLVLLYHDQGRYAEAEPLYQRALAIREQALGPVHPDTANTIAALAALYRKLGKYTEAEPLYQRALAVKEQTLGSNHPEIASFLNNMAQLYENLGKYIEAETLLQRALVINEQAFGSEHPFTATTLSHQADLYQAQGKYAEAEQLYQRSLKIFEETLPPDNPNIADILENFASLLRKMNRNEEAATMEERISAIRAKRSS